MRSSAQLSRLICITGSWPIAHRSGSLEHNQAPDGQPGQDHLDAALLPGEGDCLRGGVVGQDGCLRYAFVRGGAIEAYSDVGQGGEALVFFVIVAV